MTSIVKFEYAEGVVYVATEAPAETGPRRVARVDGVATLAKDTFDKALQQLKPLTSSVMALLKDLNNPEEITVEFGITLSAETGVVVASASAEANFKVTLMWSRKSPTP